MAASGSKSALVNEHRIGAVAWPTIRALSLAKA
jgi:hypothetical protein